MAKNWSGRLPSGKVTNNPAEYARAWHDLADPIAHAFNLTVVGWDPGILFRHTDSASTVDYPGVVRRRSARAD
jgi:hypothetical protein